MAALAARPRRAAAIAAIVGGLGAIAMGAGFAVEPARAYPAYLAAWASVVTVAIGGLAMLLIGYAANARWPAVVRRPGEAIAAALVPLAVLALPLVLAPAQVWPWVEPPPSLAETVAARQPYLSVPWFVGRTALYLLVLVIAAELPRRWSRRRDAAPEPAAGGADALDRERRFASAMLPLLGLVVTFAAFDWLMSLEPDWWSSAFGVYVLASALLAGLALTIVLGWRAAAAGALPLRPPHYHALGRVLHALVMLWAYLAYFQAMIIQIANQPSEVPFYLARIDGGWRWVTAAMVALLFALPFPLLMFRAVKRRGGALAAIALAILAGHHLEIWWLVIPPSGAPPLPSWTDVAALAAVAGLTTAVCAWRVRAVPALPAGDPYLADGLAYEEAP